MVPASRIHARSRTRQGGRAHLVAALAAALAAALVAALVATLVATLAGCSDKKSGGGPDHESSNPASGTSQAPSTAPGTSAVGAPLTPEEYERLLLGLSECQIQNEHIDPRCPAKQAFQDARKRTADLKDMSALLARLGREHIDHPSPAVRIQAAAFSTSVFGSDASSQDVVLAAARAEKEPAVLVSMIQAVGAKGGHNPAIGALLLEMADHPSPAVRKKAVIWLGSSWNEALDGSLDKLIDKVEHDPDPEVRRMACKYSGDRGDDRMIPIYETYTADPDADPKLYAACMEGLMNSWLHYPRFHTHNQKAYALTLRRLRHTPRSKETPPWTLMDNFAELANQNNKKVAEWREEARSWFQPTDVLDALEDIVMDPNAYRLARTGALESMVALGASNKTLDAIRRAQAESHDFDAKDLVQVLDRAREASTPPSR